MTEPTVYCEQSGQGPEMVLVHGWGTHGGVWTDVAQQLSSEFRLTVPDLPGHGRSREHLPAPYTPEALANAIRPHLNGPATWVGWSMGGLVALAAAQSFPGEVVRLVLVAATPKYVQGQDWPHAMSPSALNQFARELGQDPVATLERFLSLQMAAGEPRAVLRRLRSEMFRFGEPSLPALQAGLRLLREEDRRKVLATVTAPTLVVHGGRDRLAPVAAARFVMEQLPRAQLQLLPEAGHAPFLSHPDLFLKTLREFMHVRTDPAR